VPIDGIPQRARRCAPIRPAHIHFKVSARGFSAVTTHVFDNGDEYLDSDAVFGVKDSLIGSFSLHETRDEDSITCKGSSRRSAPQLRLHTGTANIHRIGLILAGHFGGLRPEDPTQGRLVESTAENGQMTALAVLYFTSRHTSGRDPRPLCT
jgi:hypothetical protein